MPTKDELIQQKEVEYYAAGVQAWYHTALEHDKSLLVLAAGGIGLLVTLLTAGERTNAHRLLDEIGQFLDHEAPALRPGSTLARIHPA